MRRLPIILLTLSMLVSLVAYTNCGVQGFKAASLSSTTLIDASTYRGKNVVPVSVGTCAYINAPCVSVTVCVPGTSNCNTIDKILVDTGSTGLRVFKQALSIPLVKTQASDGRYYAECLGYLGGSSDWGPIARADIQLADEKAPSVPMQIIDSTFMSPPSSCANLDTSPSEAGFNGILGVGLFAEDCGTACTSREDLKIYYRCASSTCIESTIAVTNQVANPVAKMPLDNNGVILQFPNLSGPATSLMGTLTLGIGSQTNNTLSGLTTFQADAYGNFVTEFDGTTRTTAFIDSGSNAYFFPQMKSAIAKCSASGNAPDFFCPSTTQSFTATVRGATGNQSKQITLSVANAESMVSASNLALPNLAGAMDDTFDWGFPFFLGRTVVTGIEDRPSNLGVGPYWAF